MAPAKIRCRCLSLRVDGARARDTRGAMLRVHYDMSGDRARCARRDEYVSRRGVRAMRVRGDINMRGRSDEA